VDERWLRVHLRKASAPAMCRRRVAEYQSPAARPFLCLMAAETYSPGALSVLLALPPPSAAAAQSKTAAR